jgi:hypothetical protein
MTRETQDALNDCFSTVRADLARQGVAWDRAWFHLRRSASSGRSALTYTERPGGPIESSKEGTGAGRLLAELRAQIQDAAGRPWNQALLTLRADGRQEAAFDYPGPAPDPGRAYAEPEILANMAECLRHNLTFDQWTEAWLEAEPDLVPSITCRNVASEPVRGLIYDCNGLDDWLDRLWKVRLESGQGPWGRFVLHLFRDGDRVEAEYQPPEPKVVEPPPLPPRKRSLDELFRRIIAAERAELDDTCRHMEKITRVRTRWKRSKLTALQEGSNVIVDRLLELTDGRTFDEPAEDDVEDLFIEVFDRVDAGDDPTGLDIPGLKVKPGASPWFILVLNNDSPAPPKRPRT